MLPTPTISNPPTASEPNSRRGSTTKKPGFVSLFDPEDPEAACIKELVCKLTCALVKSKEAKSKEEQGEISEDDDIPVSLKRKFEDDCKYFSISSNRKEMPNYWSPTIHLPSSLSNCFVKPNSIPATSVTVHKLFVLDAFPETVARNIFILDQEYEIAGLMSRGYFNLVQQLKIGYSFVFKWPQPHHAFFSQLAGMRKTAYINIKEETTGKLWELHLKPSINREGALILGFFVDKIRIKKEIKMKVDSLLNNRRLPLVLDLDDTLVRIVGGNTRLNVPESALHTIPKNRIAILKDGRKVVLAERVFEFIDWAYRLYEISICSLGDPTYVDMVKQVLDPTNTKITGVTYSARVEYDHIQSAKVAYPPKDVKTLYPWLAIDEDPSIITLDPIIVDDNANMWPIEQQDNIIMIKESKRSNLWNVNLFPHVQQTLSSIHQDFFAKFDYWLSNRNSVLFPSTLQVYKEILRRELSIKISE